MLPGDVSPTAEDHANGDMTFDTSRIEVLKGPSALRYGAYAATGVVNSFSRHLNGEGCHDRFAAIHRHGVRCQWRRFFCPSHAG